MFSDTKKLIWSLQQSIIIAPYQMFSSFSCIIRCLPEYILQDTLKNCNFRRVGKTALINEFYKDKPTIFFSAMLQHIIDVNAP